MPLALPPHHDSQVWRKKDYSLRAKLGAVSAVAVFVLAVGALGVYLVQEYRSAQLQIAHAREVQQLLDNVLQRMTDAETGQRGFLLTGAEEFLKPYRNSTQDVANDITKLQQLLRDDPAQLQSLHALQAIAKKRVDLLEGRVTDLRKGIKPSVPALRNGKVLMDSLRNVVASMDHAETAVLNNRTGHSYRRGIIAMVVIVIGSVVSFVLLLLLSRAINHDVEAREAARRRIDDQNVELRMQSGTLEEQQLELEHQLEESQVMTEELESTNAELQKMTHTAQIDREAANYARDLFRAGDQRYRFLADTIPVQVWTATPAGQLDFVSERVARYFGRTRDDVLGDGWIGVLHPDDVAPVIERWTHSLATGEPYEVMFRLRGTGDTGYRWHLGRAVALCDDDQKVVAWFGSNTDVDDQQRAQEERGRLVQALERSNVELDQFAFIASHDLKAPLRGIANLSQWIEEDAGPTLSDDARSKLELLRGRVRLLEALIDGILEYSRAGRTRIAPDTIEVKLLIEEVVEMLAPPTSTRIEVADNMPSVISERVPLAQVFSNLIGNAMKYSARPDTVIRITVKDAGPFFEFSVTDNGPGIPQQHHVRIFAVFQRLPNRDKIEGTGIGLAVVKKSAETRGGRVWVTSPADTDAGTGSTFHFTWPKLPDKES